MNRKADDVVLPRVLREYAVVADGERGALIGQDGSIVRLCVPCRDGPPVFSGLLGGPGRYTVTPADPWHVWGGYDESGTLIWRSRWVGSWRTECREALALPADPHRAITVTTGPAAAGRPGSAGQTPAGRVVPTARCGWPLTCPQESRTISSWRWLRRPAGGS